MLLSWRAAFASFSGGDRGTHSYFFCAWLEGDESGVDELLSMVLVNTPLGREGTSYIFGWKMFGAKFKPAVKQQGWLLTLSTGMFPADRSQEGTFSAPDPVLLPLQPRSLPFHTHLMRYPDWGLEAEDLCKEQTSGSKNHRENNSSSTRIEGECPCACQNKNPAKQAWRDPTAGLTLEGCFQMNKEKKLYK